MHYASECEELSEPGQAERPSDGRRRLCSPENKLLDSLPGGVYDRLAESFKRVYLNKDAIVETGALRGGSLVFPRNCVFSIRREMPDGACLEVGLIGPDGALGVEHLIDGSGYATVGVVEIGGEAICLPMRVAQQEFAQGGAFQLLLARFVWDFMNHVAQTAVCRRLHSIEREISGRLLLRQDWTGVARFITTHEQIANSLGVRREGVTLAMGHLQTAGLIRCGRGHVTIVDRQGLERRACDCYRLMRRDRLASRESRAPLALE